MSQIFPYGITLHENGKLALFPAAEVVFYTRDGDQLSLFLVVDSGASISALPKSDAEVLGIEAEQGAPLLISGIGGEPIRGWRHELRVRLGHEELRLPTVLLDRDDAPRVLGREGIFEKLLIVFDEPRRRTGLIEEETDEAQHIRKILDTVSEAS